ncbi:hypothetical protein [Geomonas subterranea]|uniref:hypothetical protein n=1 Tax=Geomonas subterranea TaxID=2847989 RepID=UPI001CD2782B|nr:hypothetical protein [Geomonas fuzhouensis]
MDRSVKAEVRNPLLALPSSRAIMALPDDVKAALRRLLLDLRKDAQEKADKSWRSHKAPMAVYWKACAVYAGHIARLLRG